MDWDNIYWSLKIVAQSTALALILTLVLYGGLRIGSAAYFKSKQEYLRRLKDGKR